MEFIYDWCWTRWVFGFDYVSKGFFILEVGPLQMAWVKIENNTNDEVNEFKKAYGK